jgi:hypothetical protein
MGPLITTKQTGKEIVIAILTSIGSFVSRLFRRKQLDQQRAKIGAVVFDLENRLRKVTIELLRAKELSPLKVQELMKEKNKLVAEIDALNRTTGVNSTLCSAFL